MFFFTDSDSGVASCVLSALGQLSAVGGDDLVPHLPRLLPMIVASLRGGSASGGATNSSGSGAVASSAVASGSGGALIPSGSGGVGAVAGAGASSSSSVVGAGGGGGGGVSVSPTAYTTRVKRDIALRTLGQLIQNTGGVIEPYSQYPYVLLLLLFLCSNLVVFDVQHSIWVNKNTFTHVYIKIKEKRHVHTSTHQHDVCV